jgi:hypothetical protein
MGLELEATCVTGSKSACRKRSPRLALVLDGLRAIRERLHLMDTSAFARS